MKSPKRQATAREKSKKSRLTSYARVPGVYVRHLKTGDRLVYRTQIDGAYKYQALDIPADAPVSAVERASSEARERLTRNAKDFGEYIAAYGVAKALKPHSITALKQALRGFGLDDEKNAAAAAAIQENDAYSQGTKRAYLQRISAFYRWMIETGEPVRNPIQGRKIPKAAQAREYGFTPDDVRRLIASVDTDGTTEDRLYVRLLRYTGARCSTIYAIAPGDCIPFDGGFHIRMKNVKCGRSYSMPLTITDNVTCNLLSTHIARHTRNFWSSSERALHDRLLRRMKKVIGETASPHGLRHFVACELLAKGVPLETISRVLDHSSIGITHAIYARQDQGTIDDALSLLGAPPKPQAPQAPKTKPHW
jgi:integrase